MNLNVSDWKEFKIGDLFECKNGSMHELSSEVSDRSIPYYTATENNNGFVGYTNEYEESDVINVPSLTVGSRGNDAITYYHEQPYIANQNLTVLIPLKSMSKYVMLFIATIIRQEKYRYSYGRLMSKENTKNTVILLPATKDGEPDFEWMEEYIKTLNYKPLTTKNTKADIPQLNTDEWKEFQVGKLFNCTLSAGDLKVDDCEKGEIPLISSGQTNNGLVSYVDSKGDGKAKIFSKGKITVDMFCNAFYQNKDFYSVSHGRVNILEPLFNWSGANLLFLSTIINKEQLKYSYGRAVYNSEISRMKIKLPICKDEDGQPIIDTTYQYSEKGFVPDWQYMENYIKSLPYGDRL